MKNDKSKLSNNLEIKSEDLYELITISFVSYGELLSFYKNRYFRHGIDWFFVNWGDLGAYQNNLKGNKKYVLEDDINRSFDVKRLLIIKVLKENIDIFVEDKSDIKNLCKNMINFENKSRVIDIDEQRVAIFPETKSYNFDKFKKLIKNENIEYLVGHNIINYDKKLLEQSFLYLEAEKLKYLDTLFLSLILFKKDSHALKKIYKSQIIENNPILDTKETYSLFMEELKEFRSLDFKIRKVLAYLLGSDKYFKVFFEYVGFDKFADYKDESYEFIKEYFDIENLELLIEMNRVEFAFILISKLNKITIPTYVLRNYPKIKELYQSFDFKFNALEYAKEIFLDKNFKYKSFDGLNREYKISQKEIIESSVNSESLLAILPTGGGKSFCYQIPAIYEAQTYRALTVIISPLRSLMKDQVENFNERFFLSLGVKSGALSGFLSPSQRAILIDEVKKGDINILYVAPEALRYGTIKKILNSRFIARVVIDEAHCLSTWGQDFRPDYRYIASFIKNSLIQKNIPISCFTATATKAVLDDINNYFKENLNLEFKEFLASNKRFNLDYSVQKIDEKKIKSKEIHEEKYKKILKLCSRDITPAIIYVPNSIAICNEISDSLKMETNLIVEAFHSKIEDRERVLREYIDNNIDIIVATTAFGMGVDKSNIKTVIHYTPSSNIEDYLQESGRAGRDISIVPDAKCIAFYHESDFDFYLEKLKNTLVTKSEISSINSVLKNIARGNKVNASALEIALDANWDVDDIKNDYKNKLNIALVELEQEGIIKRNTNITKPFATAIEVASLQETREKLEIIDKDTELQYEIMNLIQKKSRKNLALDEISYILDIDKDTILKAIHELKDKELISDNRDILVRLNQFSQKYIDSEKRLLDKIDEYGEINLKEIASNQSDIKSLKREIKLYENILRDWRDDKSCQIKRVNKNYSIWSFKTVDIDIFRKNTLEKIKLAQKIYKYIKSQKSEDENISINTKKLKNYLIEAISDKKIDKILIYLQYIKAINLLQGVFIHYIMYDIDILKRVVYTEAIYSKRRRVYYENQRLKIHIMNDFLQKQLENQNMDNYLYRYFIDNLNDFVKGFLRVVKKFTDGYITKGKFEQMYRGLTKEQKNIIDSKSNSIMILAGPGSGKTHTLVHKISNTILNDDDVKIENFLMLTYTNSAVSTFKDRLLGLVGNSAYKLDIYTFHSYANVLTGKLGLGDESSDSIKIFNENIEYLKALLPFKTALYLDEFQDINEDSFKFIQNLVDYGNISKIVAVGDDDQMIMEFNKADIKFFNLFWSKLNKNRESRVVEFELLNNFRNSEKILDLSNRFIKQLSNRKKNRDLLFQNSIESSKVNLYKSNAEYLYEIVKKLILRMRSEDIVDEVGILTHTNDEALTLQSYLLDFNIDSNLLLDMEQKYNWRNLLEIYDFNQEIFLSLRDEKFSFNLMNRVFLNIENRYRDSINFEKVRLIKNKFIEIGVESYKEWNQFLNDLDNEFFEKSRYKVTITTIHKAKGKEFSNVILLDHKSRHNYHLNDSCIRKYYVSITRAKNNFLICTNQNHFDKFEIENHQIKKNIKKPQKQIIYMSLRDISLSLSIKYQKSILELNLLAGCELELNSYYLIYKNYRVAQISKKFQEKINYFVKKDYQILKIVVDSIVYWRDKNALDRDLKQVLCKFIFEAR